MSIALIHAIYFVWLWTALSVKLIPLHSYQEKWAVMMRSRLKSSSVCWYHLTRYSCTYFVCTFLVLFIYFVWFCLVYINIPFLPFVKSFHFEVGIIRGEETVSHRLKILGHSPSTSNARERERDVQRNIILQRAKNPWVIKHAREMKWAFLRIFVLERIKAHEQTHIKSFSVSKIMNKTEYCMCLELLFCVCPQNN